MSEEEPPNEIAVNRKIVL